LFNAVVGFWQEYKADNAVEAQKRQLTLNARRSERQEANVIRPRLGDIIPADAKLFEGDFLSIDQSALSAESLPVSKKARDAAFFGSVAKEGEIVALPTFTGTNAYFGRTGSFSFSEGSSENRRAMIEFW
jgi:H+-transporting ATPase